MLLNLKRYFTSVISTKFRRLLAILLCLAIMALSSLNIYIDSKLPNEEKIQSIELQVPLKIYSSDKKLIGEFGEKRRTALRFEEIPEHYINAVLAAEDDGFFSHSGVSYSGLIRSVYRLSLIHI